MAKMSEINVDNNISEIYIDKGRVVLIGSKNVKFSDGYDVVLSDYEKEYIKPALKRKREFVYVKVYDLNDIRMPKLYKEFEIEGSYTSSRKNGSMVTIMANFGVYNMILLFHLKKMLTGPTRLCPMMI